MMRTMPRRAAALNLSSGGVRSETGEEWEMRPGGMLVQKRIPDSDQISGHTHPPPIRVRVKHGSIYHEIVINARATFGELKKMLSGPTGLHHQDQKLMFKDKERDSNAFLDMVGVKDKSKLVLVEDPVSHERRLLEMRKTAKMEKASKSISDISFEVDRLAGRVSALELVISKGAKIAETDMLGLIELLMNQLLKLDSINADGDAKLQRKIQVRRVQKYVETVDALKIKNAMNPGVQAPATMDTHKSTAVQQQSSHRNSGHGYCESKHHRDNHQQVAVQPPRQSASGTVVTTQWETFDMMEMVEVPLPAHTLSAPTSSNNPVQPKFPWEFFN